MRVLTQAARLLAALGVTAVGATAASACAICLSAVSATVGEQLDATDRAVLAAPDAGALRVLAAVKGGIEAGDAIPVTAVLPRTGAPAGAALLLAHNALADTWTPLGATDPANADWLRQVATTEGAARLALAAARLEDPDPLVAEIAHDEIARAPYAAMVGPARAVEADRLRTWADDPATGVRRATYVLLLGMAGGPEDAAAIEARLEAARRAADATDLAALLAADLELRGPDRLAWIEQTYLVDPLVTLPEIEAALLALSVHGGADGTVPRDRVVASFLRFIRARPPMASFVAPELAEWQAWDATGDYAALLQAGLVTDPAEEFAILSYLRQSPDVAAKAALADD